MTIEFYDNDMSVCCQKVRLVIYEKDIEHERHYIDLRAGEQLTPEYLAIQPKGVVPAIVEDGQPVVESTTIISYLDQAYPKPGLSIQDPMGHSRMLRWMIKPDAYLHDCCGFVSFALAFRQQLLVKSEEELEAYFAAVPDPKRREHVRELTRQGTNFPGFAPGLIEYRKLIDEMNSALEKYEWLAGDSYSLADVSIIPYVLRLEHLGLDWFWQESSLVRDWLHACKNRPNYKAITDFENARYIGLMKEAPKAEMTKMRQILGAG